MFPALEISKRHQHRAQKSELTSKSILKSVTFRAGSCALLSAGDTAADVTILDSVLACSRVSSVAATDPELALFVTAVVVDDVLLVTSESDSVTIEFDSVATGFDSVTTEFDSVTTGFFSVMTESDAVMNESNETVVETILSTTDCVSSNGGLASNTTNSC